MSGTLTTAQAAALCGMSADAFRREMHRQRTKGNDMRLPGPDARTPLWDGAALAAWLAGRKNKAAPSL